MAEDDNDKTVFGQPLPPLAAPNPASPAPQTPPPQVPPTQTPAAAPPPQSPPSFQPPPVAPPAAPPAADEDKTVFGQPMPSVPPGPQPAPGPAAPAPGAQPWNAPGPEDTWLGGALNPQPGQPSAIGQGAQPPLPHPASPTAHDPWATPAAGAGQTPPYGQPQPGAYGQPAAPVAGHGAGQGAQPIYQPGTGQRPAGAEIFPDIPTGTPDVAPQMQAPRIALSDALKGTGLGAAGASNPLNAAASDLLILLGRLRTGLVEMQAGPLIDHVTREIDQFERNALAANVPPQDVADAKYALSATADDIVQNLPGADRGMWMEYSMVARFFGERSSGVGFFEKMDQAMKAPAQRFHLLDLMLTCLSLGFEGQYRALPNGGVELTRIRTAIYETLRRVQPRPDDDISVTWTAVPMRGKRRGARVPLWAVASLGTVMVVALFATLSTLLSQESSRVRDGILALHAGRAPISIERTQPVQRPYEAPESTQLERIRMLLAAEIEAGKLEVDRKNDWVFIRVGNALQFRSGAADLKSNFSDLAGAIAQTLEREHGQIRVVGHTDSVPPSGRGRYKTNEQLSVARAQTVGDILAQTMKNPNRLEIEGKGAVDPIADNASREGRARNRRVEILIPRED